MSYLTPLKALLVEAVNQTFDQAYPVAQFRGVHCSIEYPVEPQQYPGIWVDYDDTKPLQTAGVDHLETTITGGSISLYRRWKFAGYASYTIAALTSLERDTLYDEMVRVLAFGDRSPTTERFRTYIENNDLIAANFDFDQIETRGNAAVPGTPWGTDEIIYERTLTMEVVGEFVSDSETGLLVPLSKINVLDPDVILNADEVPPTMQVSDPTGGWI